MSLKFWMKENKGRATERRHRVTIIRVSYSTVDGIVETETETAGPYWASVEPVSEKARTQYQAISVDASHVVTLDGRVDVAEKDKIKFGERTFDVLTVKRVDEGFRDLVLITQEIRPG